MSLKADILNVLGHDSTSTYLTDDIDEYSVIEQGIWKAANALPAKLLLMSSSLKGLEPENIDDDPDGEQNTLPSALSQNGSDISANDLILHVERVKSENVTPDAGLDVTVEKYDYKTVKEVHQTEKDKVLDADSIYFATDFSPVYWLENKLGTSATENTRKIFTAPTTIPTFYKNGVKNWLSNGTFALKIYIYSRQTSITDSTDEYTGIPTLAKSFVDKVCALELLNIKIAEQSTEEEDSELFTLLTNQKAMFEKDLKEELDTLREMYK